MKIINKDGQEIFNPDLTKGKLVPDKLFVKHYEAVPAAAEQSHYETVAEYPNGGRDIRKVIDVPAQDAIDAWDEYEEVMRYVLLTPEELEQQNKPDELDSIRANIAYLAMMTGNMEGMQL